jgi:hypothetical protein
MKKIKPAPRKPITKLKTPYEGGDTLMEWHNDKLKSTPRDADYFTPIWRCENDWDRAKEYIVWGGMWIFFLFTLYQGAIAFEKWIGS